MKQYHFSIIVEQDKDGYFVFCPELQGCYSQGGTYEEAVENIEDVIKLYIADRRWEEVIDFTKVKKGGITLADLLSRL